MSTYTAGSTWWIGPQGITVNGSSLVGLQLVVAEPKDDDDDDEGEADPRLIPPPWAG